MAEKHPYSRFLIAIADGDIVEFARSQNGPWLFVSANDTLHKIAAAEIKLPNDRLYFRLKPQCILVNGHSIEKPFTGTLKQGQVYWLAGIYAGKPVADDRRNGNPEMGFSHVLTGLVHLTKEAAMNHAEALLNPVIKE